MDQEDKTFVNPNQDTLDKLRINKQSAFTFRRRRQPDWLTNYTLYRDRVMTNRLTQRQSVNIPLIKSTIKTLLKDIDDPPMLNFANLENNDQAEVYYNEYWEFASQRNQLVLKDVVDKRQVMLFGRSFKFMNIVQGHFYWEIVDPQDVLVDRYVDPTNIDSARFVIREHIYVPLASLKTNPMFDNAAVRRIQEYMTTEPGLLKASQNQLDWVEKQSRVAALGVTDAFSPVLGETYVELVQFFYKEFDKKSNADRNKLTIVCEEMEVLYSKDLEEHIGQTSDDFWVDHYPVSTWADETERTDFWSDGVADPLRTLNIVLNSWFSQMVENRSLQNFGMNYFNSSLGEEGFTPQTFEAVPWGWYPIPVGASGKITDSIMRVDIPDLSSTLGEIEFIMNLAQQSSAATTFQQGIQPQGQQVTLGEVQLLLKNAQEKVKAMSVYYTESWKDFGVKYTKLLEAAGDLIDETQINKKGRMSKKNYAKKISPKMWYSKAGYKVEVLLKQDMEEKTAADLQKLQYSKSIMPMNHTLDTIIKKKSLEFSDLTSSEISEVLKEDEIAAKAMAAQQAMQQTALAKDPKTGMPIPGQAAGAMMGGPGGAPQQPMAQ